MKTKINNIDQISRKELRYAIKRADPDILEDAIVFLEDDPRTFGSGYAKELIWKYIKRYDLSSEQLSRLENAVIAYLFRPMSREFKYMCQTMSRIASDRLWENIKSYLDSENPRVQVNSYCLYAYSDGVMAGEKLRLEFKEIISVPMYFGLPPHTTIEQLMMLVKDYKNWNDDRIIYRELDLEDLPIYRDYIELDKEFARLDVESCNKLEMLETLDSVLSTGFMNVFNSESWVYSIYLLRQMNDKRAVQILGKFLKNKIDYKFDGPRKSLFVMLSLKVLRHYRTSYAVKIIDDHSEDDALYSSYYAGKSTSWVFSYPTIES